MAVHADLASNRRWSVCTLCIATALLSLVCGCAGIDGTELADLSLTQDGFEFHASTTLFYPPNANSWAEVQRLHWLEAYLGQNGVCPYGYQLISRRVAFKFQSPLGNPVDEIVYQGRCRG